MARPRLHDEQQARNGALDAFRRAGFEGTSVSDLEEATGVGRRQLYNQYGDKRGVFLQALADFQQLTAELFLKDLEAPGAGLKAVKAGLPLLIRLGVHRGESLGCLLCNTASEPIGMADEEIRQQIVAFWGRIEAAYGHALSNAVALGEIQLTPRRVERIARRFRASHLAICLMMRAGESESVLMDVAREAIEAVSN